MMLKMPFKPGLAIAILLALSTILLALAAARHAPAESARTDSDISLPKLDHDISQREPGTPSAAVRGGKERTDVREAKLVIGLPNILVYPKRPPDPSLSCKAKAC